MSTPPSQIHFETLRTRQQLQQLRDLLQAVFGTTSNGKENNLDTIGSNPTICAIGARSGDILVGGLIAYELPLLNGTKEMYLYDIAVLPSYQKQGVGTGLIGALKAEAKERGVGLVYVEAEDDDEGAVLFYRSLCKEEIGVRHFTISIV